jgi:hypothetical protein
MVTRERAGNVLLDPPGTVLHLHPYRRGRAKYTIVYLELPDRRRRSIDHVAKRLGRGALKRLRRGGLLRRDLADLLSNLWED